MRSRLRRPSPALIIGIIALVAAVTGTAAALPGTNTVRSDDIVNGQVFASDIADGTINSNDLSAVLVGRLPKTFNKSATANGALDDATAIANSPKTTLVSKPPFTLYGKCFTSVANPNVRARIFIQTTENGDVFRGGSGSQNGGPVFAVDFLNSATAETDRQVLTVGAAQGATASSTTANMPFYAQSSSKTLVGELHVSAKGGTLVQGDGVYGPGNRCLFSGFTTG